MVDASRQVLSDSIPPGAVLQPIQVASGTIVEVEEDPMRRAVYAPPAWAPDDMRGNTMACHMRPARIVPAKSGLTAVRGRGQGAVPLVASFVQEQVSSHTGIWTNSPLNDEPAEA